MSLIIATRGLKEEKTAGRGGTVEDIGEGLSCLQETIGERVVFKVSGKGVDSGG